MAEVRTPNLTPQDTVADKAQRAVHDTVQDSLALDDQATAAVQAETDAAVEEPWQVPPSQPLRVVAAVLFLAAAATCYGYTLLNFWSSPALGIHLRIPYPAFLLIALSLILGLTALRIALGLWSPHAKLAIAGLALLACLTFGVGGGRFVSYTMRGTRNPPFKLALAVNDRFPDFRLIDQNGRSHDASLFGASPQTLVVVYRGDFDPFARFELNELTRMQEQFRQAGVQIVAVSADPPQRSTMLAHFLGTQLPLLSDPAESLLGPLGLVQHYSNGQPDSAIPAFFLASKERRVKWIFTSPYYREQPRSSTILEAARGSVN
jgi:peroxiredoxin